MIRFMKVSKSYGESHALQDVNLHIRRGDFFVLVGPSGSGKSTTLKMINRLIEPTSGHITFEGVDLRETSVISLRRQCGYVLQNIALFPHMSVEENVGLLPELSKWRKEEKEKRVRELLTSVNLDPESYGKRYPRELSGGEQQRVGILRAMAINPKVMLMDEPFSALDPITRKQLQDLILKLHKEFCQTIVFVTHDMQEALRLGTRIALMKEGRVLQCGTPLELIENPANEFVENFFDKTKRKAVELLPYVKADEGMQRPKVGFDRSLNRLMKELKKAPEGIALIDDEGKVRGVIGKDQLLTYLVEEKVMLYD